MTSIVINQASFPSKRFCVGTVFMSNTIFACVASIMVIPECHCPSVWNTSLNSFQAIRTVDQNLEKKQKTYKLTSTKQEFFGVFAACGKSTTIGGMALQHAWATSWAGEGSKHYFRKSFRAIASQPCSRHTTSSSCPIETVCVVAVGHLKGVFTGLCPWANASRERPERRWGLTNIRTSLF